MVRIEIKTRCSRRMPLWCTGGFCSARRPLAHGRDQVVGMVPVRRARRISRKDEWTGLISSLLKDSILLRRLRWKERESQTPRRKGRSAAPPPGVPGRSMPTLLMFEGNRRRVRSCGAGAGRCSGPAFLPVGRLGNSKLVVRKQIDGNRWDQC